APACVLRLVARAVPRGRGVGGRRAGDEGRAPVGLGFRDRRLPALLSRRDEHAARPALAPTARPRADALLRRRPPQRALEAAHARLAAVRLLGTEDRGHRERDRRDHRRDTGLDPGRPRRRDRPLQPVLLDGPGAARGDEHHLRRARIRVLRRGRPGRAPRPATSSGARRMSDGPAVSIQGVSKQFKAGVTALSGIDLDVRPQELISLIGPSGCGKSTLLRIIGDLIDPSEGVVEVNGKPASQARRDHDYGIVFQEAVLYDWRTVSKNIALPLELLRWSREKRTQRVNELLRLV